VRAPQAIWTSRDGLTWTLAATHGITPQLPSDQILVLNDTAQGFLAAGQATASGGGTQGVIWTSRDGLTWQRKTAAQLGLTAPEGPVRSIVYAAVDSADTVISGGVSVSGLGSDGSGLIAVRTGQAASGGADGVSYFSPNGHDWQYAGTLDAAGGWSPNVVKGSGGGFVVTGTTTARQIVAYTSTGTGGTWQPTGSLGHAASESVESATLGAGGTVIAVGATAGGATR
jgi:hypothetical protein